MSPVKTSYRRRWEADLNAIARSLPQDEWYNGPFAFGTLHLYYCTRVMQVVNHLRRCTRARDLQAQHDVLKIILKYLIYGTRGRFEIRRGRYRMDVFINDHHEVIEVKTIVDATVRKLKSKGTLVIKKGNADRLWVVFFYKFFANQPPSPACKYLLCWVDLNLREISDVKILNEAVITMVQEGKTAVAKKLGVREEIIIPVDNIMLAEELERENEEKDAIIIEKDATIAEKDATIAEKDATIAEKDATIAQQQQELGDKEKKIADLKRRMGIH